MVYRVAFLNRYVRVAGLETDIDVRYYAGVSMCVFTAFIKRTLKITLVIQLPKSGPEVGNQHNNGSHQDQTSGNRLLCG